MLPVYESQIIKWVHQIKNRFSFLCVTILYELYRYLCVHVGILALHLKSHTILCA